MRKLITLIFVISSFIGLSQNGNYNGWGFRGNILGVSTSSIGSIDNRSYWAIVGGKSFLKFDSTLALRFAPTTTINTVSGSIYYDNSAAGTGLTIRTNSTNTNMGLSVTDGSITASVLPLNLSGGGAVYNGPWIGSRTQQNVHLVANINGGNVPAITISSQAAGAVSGVLINGPTTYTTTSALDVYDGGGVNNIRSATAANAETFRVEKTTGNAYHKGLAVIGSTVASTTHTLSVNGGANITTTLSVGGGGTVITGNSGTVAVFTDNLFTLNASFIIQALSASTSYYWSTNSGLGVRTTVDQSTLTIPYNATLVGASICAWNAGNTTSQTNSTLNFRLNGSDNVVSSAVLWNTGSCANCGISINVTNLNVSVTAGDRWENKLTLGALATPPNNGNVTVTYYFQRR